MLLSNSNSKFLFVFLPLLLTACYTESEFNEVVDTPNVEFENTDSRLWAHFSEFEREANLRGVEIDLNALDLISSINDIDDDGVAGYCSFTNNNPHRIVIDSEFWNQANATIKEMVVFHELGHCALLRGHSEHSINGVCQSIMASGLGSCTLLYNSNNRTKYLNELFSDL